MTLCVDQIDNNLKNKLPEYTGLHQVWALKIKEIKYNPAAHSILTFEEEEIPPLKISDWNWFYKNQPESGGYFVIFKNNHKKYISADIFEKLYKLKESDPKETKSSNKKSI